MFCCLLMTDSDMRPEKDGAAQRRLWILAHYRFGSLRFNPEFLDDRPPFFGNGLCMAA
jgi:hypothetical protein